MSILEGTVADTSIESICVKHFNIVLVSIITLPTCVRLNFMNFIALIFPTGTYKTSSSKNIEEDICQMVATIRPFELLEMAADIIWTAFLQDCDVLLLKSVFLPNSFVLYSHFDSEKLA